MKNPKKIANLLTGLAIGASCLFNPIQNIEAKENPKNRDNRPPITLESIECTTQNDNVLIPGLGKNIGDDERGLTFSYNLNSKFRLKNKDSIDINFLAELYTRKYQDIMGDMPGYKILPTIANGLEAQFAHQVLNKTQLSFDYNAESLNFKGIYPIVGFNFMNVNDGSEFPLSPEKIQKGWHKLISEIIPGKKLKIYDNNCKSLTKENFLLGKLGLGYNGKDWKFGKFSLKKDLELSAEFGDKKGYFNNVGAGLAICLENNSDSKFSFGGLEGFFDYKIFEKGKKANWEDSLLDRVYSSEAIHDSEALPAAISIPNVSNKEIKYGINLVPLKIKLRKGNLELITGISKKDTRENRVFSKRNTGWMKYSDNKSEQMYNIGIRYSRSL